MNALVCPGCKQRTSTLVMDSRMGGVFGHFIRRRRECRECKARYTTQERLVGQTTDDVAALKDARAQLQGALVVLNLLLDYHQS
jgi:transcriptional regulator NrdR family protein